MSTLGTREWTIGLPFLLSVLCTGLSIPVADALGILDRPVASISTPR